MRAGNRRGQHTAEFALLIGLAAVAAVAMQLIVRRTLQDGIQHASDRFLPPKEVPPDDTQRELLVTVKNAADEAGSGNRVTTRTRTSVIGHSVNEDVRLTGGGS